jgi:prepilin-type N-terminal cleavage/methylation domain-containing protein
MLRLRKNQQGDTIVEVLIAIAVVSMVLVAAYVTTVHSVNTMEDTQEHSEALQLAQTQLEFLHNYNSSVTPVADGDCFKADGTLTATASNCVVNASGTTTAPTLFTIKITNDSPPTYAVAVTWASLSQGGTTNDVTLYYQP